MQLDDCYYLGTIIKTHGLKGHLVAKLDTDEPEKYNNLESVFININGIPVPFFIEECHPLNTDFLRIKFEDTPDAENLIGTDLYLPLHTLPQLKGKQFYYHEVINFSLTDENNQIIIGKIIEINDMGPQALFVVQISDEKNIYLPIINEWIIEVNREKKFISMSLPEGILDL